MHTCARSAHLPSWGHLPFLLIALAACATSRPRGYAAAPSGADTVVSMRTDSATAVSVPAHDGADTAISYRPMSFAEFTNRVVGPRALLGDFALAGLQQATHRPAEWPKNWDGYESRVSSRLGARAISNTFELGVSAAFNERPAQFSLCSCTGTSRRFLHAMLSPLRMDTPHGPHYSPIGPLSAIGGSILITSLQPRGFSAGDGVRGGAVGILGSSLVSVAREFWPWHWRPFGW